MSPQTTPHYVSGSKYLLTEIYRNIQTFAFKELEECSYWASRNDAVQMFFLTPNRNMFAGKFFSQKGFWLYCGSILFSMSSELRFMRVKCMRFFEQNCIVKWVIFFASFCWFCNFLLENLKFKKTDNVH